MPFLRRVLPILLLLSCSAAADAAASSHTSRLRQDDLLHASPAVNADTAAASIRAGEIRFTGLNALSRAEAASLCSTREGSVIETDVLESDIDRLLSWYERNGYPFASAFVGTLDASGLDSSGRIGITINVTEGPLVTIDEIVIRGNHETDPGVIIRETGIRIHEKYNQDRIASIVPRLNRLNIFASVAEPEVFTGPTGGGLVITVVEGSTNSFDGIAGYLPSQNGGGGTLTGMVNIGMRNLFGTARKFSVAWQQDAHNTQELGFRYQEPWVAGLPVTMGAGFHQRQQDSTFVVRTMDGSADLLIDQSLTAGGTLTYETVIPTAGSYVVGPGHTVSAGLAVRYDSRDDPVSPMGGIDYRTHYQFGEHSSSLPGSSVETTSGIQRISVDLAAYLHVSALQIAALGFHGRSLTGDRLGTADLYRFGGATTLRGYRENQFIGARVAWTNAEYRFLMGRHSFFYGFLDSGYYDVPADVTGAGAGNGYKTGYGIGVQMETGLGNIGVSLAFGQGDGLGDGKLHLRLINDF